MEFTGILIERINQFCDERNLSINRLATLAEIKTPSLDSIIKGKTTNPTLLTIVSLAIALEMNPSEFLNFDAMNTLTFQNLRKYRKGIVK